MKGAYSLRFSRSAQTYDKWGVPQKESARKLVSFVKPHGSILDLGCGTGFVSSFLPPGCVPFGLDIAPKMVEIFHRRFGRAVVGDAESLPFKDGSFDFVLSNFSLHWTDLSKSLREVVRVARVGVGLALPVEGSLKGLDFPFPKEEEVIGTLGGLKLKYEIREVRIPFEGWDLVRFFHHTGSSLNPNRRRPLTKKEILNLINSIESPTFRMLFLYARVV